MPLRRIAWSLAALLLIATIYGISHEQLYLIHTWGKLAAPRLLGYAVAFCAGSGLILWRWPGRLLPIACAFVLVYTVWWAGPIAPLAVLYFLGSCLLLGRLVLGRMTRASRLVATLVGAGIWMFAIWIALHFRVNFRWTYILGLALPYFAARKELRGTRPKFSRDRGEAFALAALIGVSLPHWLDALKPETSSDGLSMHLALPVAVAQHGRWAFDFHLNTWALMPAGGDSLFTAAYLLGGETAARLLNFSFLAMIAALIVIQSRRWVSPAWAYLTAALFVSTPLVQLVTGSLFVENVWAAMILGATIVLIEYRESRAARLLITIGILCGAALAVKLMAAAFVAPIALMAFFQAVRGHQWRALTAASALLVLLGTPAYAFAYLKTGNPVFPFENQIFKSPDWDTEHPFTDSRFRSSMTWSTPYDITFRSGDFMEAQGGASGFQYFLLLIPAILASRRRTLVLVLIGMIGAATVLLATSYLRYLYPALPLFSIAIGTFLAEAPGKATAGIALALVAVNLWFNPASGPYDRNFALFRHRDIEPYLEQQAPARLLIDRLNRDAPGEPAAILGPSDTGGLSGTVYADNWHSETFWRTIIEAPTTEAIAKYIQQLGVVHVIAPVSRHSTSLVERRFLEDWLDLDGARVGELAIFRLRDKKIVRPLLTGPFPVGIYEDLDPRVEYTGSWLHDVQFPPSSDQSITYSQVPGDGFRIPFEGASIDYVYTTAPNRGIAEILIDGRQMVRLNQYSAQIAWQVSHKFSGLTPGFHILEVKVSGEKDPQSSNVFVDLDAFRVE